MSTAAADTKRDLFLSIGDSGLDHRNGVVQGEFLRQLQGVRGMERLREMAANDAISGAILTLWGLLFRSAEKRITPASAEDKAAQDAAEFVRTCMKDMDHLWSTVEDEFLTSFVYGNSLHEIVLKRRSGPEAQFPDGRIGWQSIRLRSQTTIRRWFTDPATGKFATAEQWTNNGKVALIPLDRCVHFRTTDVLDDPNGVSMLRSGFRNWHFSSNLEEKEAISLDRRGGGLPVFEVPPPMLDDESNSARLNTLIDKMADIRNDDAAALIIPGSKVNGQETGYRFWFATADGPPPAFDATIRRHDSRRAMVLFGDFLLLGHESVGSYALSDSKTNVAALALGSILKRFCETFTKQAIHPLCAINGIPRAAWPTLEHGDIETPDLTELASFVNSMVGANVLTLGPELEEYIRTAAGLPKQQMADLSTPSGAAPAAATGAPVATNPDGTPMLSTAAQDQVMNVGQTIRQLSLSVADMASAAAQARAAGDDASATAFLDLAAELREKIRALNTKL